MTEDRSISHLDQHTPIHEILADGAGEGEELLPKRLINARIATIEKTVGLLSSVSPTFDCVTKGSESLRVRLAFPEETGSGLRLNRCPVFAVL